MFFNIRIFRKHICSATCGEMYYTEFYFKSDAISIEDRANFHLCCYVKYDIHCTQFHETALCGDLLYRIPLQLVKKNGSYWCICIHATKYDCHCSNFHKAHAYLTTFVKTTYTKFNRSWTDVWSSQTKMVYFIL